MKRLFIDICFFAFIALIWFFVSGCHSSHTNEPDPTAEIPLPLVTDDGWEVASLSSVGMDAAKLGQLLKRLDQTSDHHIHSILIVKNGKLVFEQYYPGLKFNLGQYTGGSGLTYDDETLPYTDSRNDMNRFYSNRNPIRFLLALPLYAAPGAVFDYDNCNTNILGQIISQATGDRLDRFATKFLFDHLGISQVEWQIVRDEVVLRSGDLHLRPRDMAKFGLLFLRRGEWNGKRIISPAWCDVSTAQHINPNDYNAEFQMVDGYGYQW